MPHAKLTSSSIAIVALFLAGTAHAASTRSGSNLPTFKPASYTTSNSGRSVSSLPTHVGPKDGFRENHGLEEAREHSNEHSAHHRGDDDSPGS
ncbi:MAG: hypothetical protein RIS94_2379 [Pseudomonadota bacterium]|jgi:hypothetical protein